MLRLDRELAPGERRAPFLFFLLAFIVALALPATALAEPPVLTSPQSGSAVDESDTFSFDAQIGWVRVQFATDDQFSSVVCDTGWSESAFDSTISWAYPGPIAPSAVSCPLAVGTYFWRAGWSAVESPSPAEAFWSDPWSVRRSSAAITGTAEVGQALSASPANWPLVSGSAPSSYSHAWQRCVGELYATEVMRDGPAAYYRLGDSAEALEIVDATGNENVGTFRNGVIQEQVGGLFEDADGAVSFDGVDDHVDAADSADFDLGDAFTIEAWVRPNGNGFTGQIVQKGPSGYTLRLSALGGIVLAKSYVQDIASTPAGVTVPLDGAYHHVVATKNGSAVKLYLDGVDVTGSVSNATIVNTSAPLQIGRAYQDATHYGNYFKGEIDEVALYRGAMPEVRVRAHWDLGSSGCMIVAGAGSSSYTLTTADYGATMRVLVTGTYPSGSSLTAPSNETAVVGTQRPVNEEAPVVWGETTVSQTLTAGEGAWAGASPLTYSHQWQTCLDRQYRTTVLADSPNGYWRLGELSGPVAADTSGYGNGGTYTGGVTQGVQGALTGSADTNRGARFDGVNDFVQVPDANSLDLGDSFTIEEWVRRNVGGVKGHIVQKGINGYALHVGTDDLVHLGKPGTSGIAVSTVSIPTDGNYHHVVATKNGSVVHIYVDGVDVTGTVSNLTIQNTTAPLQIGRYYNNTNGGSSFYFNGDLDEVAVYTTALSEARVLAHYEMGTSGCSDISGATGTTYTAQSSDVGKRLRVVATATNAAGSGQAASAPSSSSVLSSSGPVIASGTLTDASGNPLSGVTVTLHMWPNLEVGSEEDEPSVGDPVDSTLITQATTDASGNYALASAMTPAMQAVADENGGHILFEVNAEANGVHWVSFVNRNFGPADGSVVQRLGSSLAAAPAVWRASETGVRPEPVTLSLRSGELGVGTAESGTAEQAAAGCSLGDLWNRKWKFNKGIGRPWAKVGEVLAWKGMSATYTYGTHNARTFGFGLQAPANPWRIGGSITFERTTGSAVAFGADIGAYGQWAIRARYKAAEYLQCGTGKKKRRPYYWIRSSNIRLANWVTTPFNGHCEKINDNYVWRLNSGVNHFTRATHRGRRMSAAISYVVISASASTQYDTQGTTVWNTSSSGSRYLCGLGAEPDTSRRVFWDDDV
jgi:hypothetical protein